MMACPVRTKWANKFRDRREAQKPYFSTDNEFYTCIGDYIQWTRDNPVLKPYFDPATETLVHEPRRRIPSILGFSAWTGISTNTLNIWSETKPDGTESKMSDLAKHMKSMFHAELADEALNGNVNANLAARIAGLADRQDIRQKIDAAVVEDDSRIDDMVEELDRGIEEGLGPKEGERPTAATEGIA